MTRRRTGDWQLAAKAERYGIELGKLRRIYEQWAREEAEQIDVIEAVGRFLEAAQ
jgi:hypothetical protein